MIGTRSLVSLGCSWKLKLFFFFFFLGGGSTIEATKGYYIGSSLQKLGIAKESQEKVIRL